MAIYKYKIEHKRIEPQQGPGEFAAFTDVHWFPKSFFNALMFLALRLSGGVTVPIPYESLPGVLPPPPVGKVYGETFAFYSVQVMALTVVPALIPRDSNPEASTAYQFGYLLSEFSQAFEDPQFVNYPYSVAPLHATV